jgi:dolichol-phosphate mannosyltransferase|tara:strand:- start:2469 stop:3164 length:696 start_codon:yes stop_codon:yes gene_type:complete
MLLTVIIPCFNEKKNIIKILNKVFKQKTKKQIILVDDFSTDGTREIIKKFKKKVNKIIYHKKNLGKGACIISAKRFVKGDVVIIQDSDLEYNPQDYKKLIAPILSGKYSVVYGSRVLNKSNNIRNTEFISNFRIFGNYLLTLISNFLNNQKLTDAHTCYKVFKKDIFLNIRLKEKGFNFCPEVTTKVSNLKIEILEVPISYRGRTAEEGKKIKFYHAIEAFLTIVKYKIIK